MKRKRKVDPEAANKLAKDWWSQQDRSKCDADINHLSCDTLDLETHGKMDVLWTLDRLLAPERCCVVVEVMRSGGKLTWQLLNSIDDKPTASKIVRARVEW